MINKTSDKNVANVEDDVKIVKRYLENSAYKESDSDFFKNGGWEMVDLEIPKAMANILAEREQKDKQIQKLEEERDKYNIRLTDEEYRKVIENAQMDTSNDSVIAHKFAVMQQQLEQKDKRIQELEEERQLVGIPVRNKRDGKIGIVLHQWENGSIAVLERINPRIINTHDSWNTLEIITDEVKQIQTQDDSIPKQAVIDKIKKLKKRKDKYEYETQEIFSNAYYDRKRLEIIHKIDILQELLEGEK